MAAGALDELLSRVPVDHISERARKARPGKAAAIVIAGAIFGIAWLTGKLFTVVWFALAWCWMAADEGFRAARGMDRPAPDLAALQAENKRLRHEIARLS